MKNLKLNLVTFLCLTLTIIGTSRSANAGIVIGLATGDVSNGAAVGLGLGAAGAAVAVTVGALIEGDATAGDIAGVFLIVVWPGIFVGTLLDVDASLPTDRMITQLRQALPFIDNQEAIRDLVVMTKDRFKENIQRDQNSQNVLVQLSREEVAQALASSDLTHEQFEQVVKVFE